MGYLDLLCDHPWYTFIILVLLYNAIFPIKKKTLPKGAVILLTGGAQGLGKLLSKEFTTKHKDVKLVIIDVQPALGQATVEELKKDTGVQSIEYINVDISDPAALNAAWK